MSKKNAPEVLILDSNYFELFKQAVKNTSKRTLIRCNSIEYNDKEHTVLIYDTRSYFLLILGEEYFKLTLSSYLKKDKI